MGLSHPTGQSGELPDCSSLDDLSSYLDLLLSQEEYHRDQLLRIKELRRQAEAQVPDAYNDLWNQINDILEGCS